MKKSLIALAVCGAMSTSMVAQADVMPEGVYSTVALERMSIEGEGGYDANPLVVSLGAGYEIMDNVSVEGKVGFGVDDDADQGLDADVNYMASVFVKADYDLTDEFSANARVGLSHVDVDFDAPGIHENDDVTGLGYGIGVSYQPKGTQWEYSAGYDVLVDGHDFNAESLSVTVSYKY
ncbi:porin family protein [Neptuniibacter sp. QD37_11]|uniref:porin family protein n=1 Tax=Neptuniibacter sp. QD37_11 TaxID=3398209 RepID=UPI0039F4D7C0